MTRCKWSPSLWWSVLCSILLLGFYFTGLSSQTSRQAQAVKAFPVQFVDITRQSGIRFMHNTGAFGKKYLPETMGSGCAFLDYNNDGWQDVLLINGMDWPGHKRRPSYPALYR
ncbi:MAG TPA: hypothetical protein VHP35_01505, partial [Terriglobia bacterium]|nr:hypothetical protein [Terriglobia bacterium]